MRRDGVPPEGPNVFTPEPGVQTQWVAGITSLTGQEVWLKFRFPGFVCRLPPVPVRESVILMGDKPVVTLDPTYVDPYHLEAMLAERALR